MSCTSPISSSALLTGDTEARLKSSTACVNVLNVKIAVLILMVGVGENIRGTGLGAADTIAHEGENKGDAIAQRGREEMSKGMANMGRRAPAEDQSYTDTRAPTVSGHTNQGTSAKLELSSNNLIESVAVDGTGAHPRGYNDAVGTETHSMPTGKMPSGTHTSNQHPNHHRDDAISNEPDAINVGRQHEFQEYQSHPELGAYNESEDRSSAQ